MKIALIGPGIMPIPPTGWGAIEILIWEYYNELKKRGHDVTIINTKDSNEIITTVNLGRFDFVHLHYDRFIHLIDYFSCPCIALTSHYPYIDRFEKHSADGYEGIFYCLANQRQVYNFVLADKDMNALIKQGADKKRIKKIKNGINSQLFQFAEKPKLDRTICLGKITPRKNQARFQSLHTIDFVGNCDDANFNTGRPNYLGEWTNATLYENLTNYANLFLFSEGEADPLVVKEALIAGLGVVVNRSSAANLDLSKDFITVVDDDKIDDLEYIFYRLEENKSKSVPLRKEIREYGVANFDISVEVDKYLEVIQEIRPKTTWQLPSLGTHIDLRKLYLVDHRKKAADSSL